MINFSLSKKVSIIKSLRVKEFPSFLKDFVSIASALSFRTISQFFSNYFAALWLGPSDFGLWQGLKLILLYAPGLNLGVNNAMYREIPILKGEDEEKNLSKINIIENTSFAFSLAMGAVISFSLIGLSFFFSYRWYLRLIAIAVFLSYLNEFYGYYWRAHKSFQKVSKVESISGIGSLITVGFVYLFRLIGVILGVIIQQILTVFYYIKRSRREFNLFINIRTLLNLIKIGFPISAMVYAYQLFTTVDRLIILKYLGKTALGYYSLGSLAFVPIGMLFTSFNSVVYPRLGELYGKVNKDPKKLKEIVFETIYVLSLIISPLVGFLILFLPLFVKVFLPQYMPGVKAADFLFISLLLISVMGMASMLLLVTNRQMINLLNYLSAAIINGVVSIVIVKFGFGIEGVALGTLVAYFSYFLLTMSCAKKILNLSNLEFFKVVAKILLPIFAITFAVLGLDSFVRLDFRIKIVIILFLSSTFYLKSLKPINTIIKWSD